MAKRTIKAGSTDVTIDVFIMDSSSTTGGGKTGLAYNTASLVCYYRKNATGSATALTLATQTVGGAHSDGGFVEIDATNMPGMYRLDLSDTIVATGPYVTIMLKGAANMAPVVIELELVAVDPFDAVRGGMTALPNAAAAAAGGLIILGSNNTAAITIGALTVGAIAGTTLTLSGAVAFQSTFAITGATTFTGAISGTNASNDLRINGAVPGAANGILISGSNAGTTTLGALTVTGATTLTGAVSLGSTLGVTGAITFSSTLTSGNISANLIGNITGNLSGSVGSVTGAVGSVTGNVGGNVTGSVGSVVGAVGSVTGNVGGNVTGTIGGLTAAALKDFFDTDSTTTYASAVAGSVVKEIADNAGGTGLTAAAIADAVWDEDATAHQTGGTFGQAIGDPGADTNTIFKAVVTDATGATVGVDVVAMKADTAAILVDTGTTLDGRIPAALVGGRMDCNVGAIDGETTSADRLAESTKAIAKVVVGVGSTTTSIVTSSIDPSVSVGNQLAGQLLMFSADTTTVALRNQKQKITASSAGGVLTCDAFTTAPANTDTATIC